MNTSVWRSAALGLVGIGLTFVAAQAEPVSNEAQSEPQSSATGAAPVRDTRTAPADAAGSSDAQRPVNSGAAPKSPAKDDFDFFSDKPVESRDVVDLPPPKPAWQTVGGPIALTVFFFALNVLVWWFVPFESKTLDVNLRHLPPAVRRGIAMAVIMFGFAFCFGASEIWYQLKLNGSAEAYFAQMSLGKLIAFTHAHLFGFTTSFFIIGIPFSMQYNHLKVYQWVFPVGLAASLTDVMSWWGIKFVSPNFEYVSMFCGVLFTVAYGWMLIGLLRTLLFPEVIWPSDKDKDERRAEQRARRQADRSSSAPSS